MFSIVYNKNMELQRYEKAKAYVYEQFAKINNEPLRIAALTHTAMVDSCITLLAISRSSALGKG